MPGDYVGNPATNHGVTLPSLSNAVQIKTIVDFVDPLNASAVHGASVTVLADWIEFLKAKHAGLAGVTPWDAEVTYAVGKIVVDPDTLRVYRAKVAEGNTDKQPSENATYWDRIDYSATDIKALTAEHTLLSPAPAANITCTRGATVSRANVIDFAAGQLRVIIFEVAGIPWDNSVEVDLSASDAAFSSVWYGGLATLRSGGYQYGGQVGLNAPSTGKDVFTIWAKKGSGDPGTSCTVSVAIWGS